MILIGWRLIGPLLNSQGVMSHLNFGADSELDGGVVLVDRVHLLFLLLELRILILLCERIFVELMTSDRKLEASREGSK